MIASTTEVTTAVDNMVARYTVAVEAISPDLEANTQTQQQVRNLEATMTGLVGDVRRLRTDLDTTDTATLLLTANDAERLLAVWTWERETRSAVQGFVFGVIESADIAKELNEGSDRATVTTRAGDTLQSIAARELGNFAEWPRILDANPGLLPGTLAAGTVLILPEKR